jgi:hypothetical protein
VARNEKKSQGYAIGEDNEDEDEDENANGGVGEEDIAEDDWNNIGQDTMVWRCSFVLTA